MANLIEYLAHKRKALLERRERLASGSLGPTPLLARAIAEGRSGVRRIRIRDFQVITDSPTDFAGYDLGPSSPELQLGILGSCLNHSYLIQAAALEVPIESIEVEVEGTIDRRAGSPGYENTPVYPQNIAYVVKIASPASPAQIDALREKVERACPILNLLKNPQTIRPARHSFLDARRGGVIPQQMNGPPAPAARCTCQSNSSGSLAITIPRRSFRAADPSSIATTSRRSQRRTNMPASTARCSPSMPTRPTVFRSASTPRA
jgi:uncharacterized OsmC-like protein